MARVTGGRDKEGAIKLKIQTRENPKGLVNHRVRLTCATRGCWMAMSKGTCKFYELFIHSPLQIMTKEALKTYLPRIMKTKVPWTARRSNQSILKEINPEYSLEGLMLKLQYFGHLMWTADPLKRLWCWGRLRAGREGGNGGWDGWMASLTQWTWIWASSRR